MLLVGATLALALTACPVPVTVGRINTGPAPVILYTDLLTGPTTGGEHNNGAYLSLFGRHFGTDLSRTRVRIAGVDVARLITLGPAKGRAGIQQLTVQVGPLGNAPAGEPAFVELTVDGLSASTVFTPQPGDTLFLDSVNGNDSTAIKNDITHPWRTLQTPTGGGALAVARAGDVLVLRGTGVWSDIGQDNRWVHFSPIGRAPTGQAGTGPITLMAYPGETVRFVPQSGTKGGLHGASSGPGAPWVTLSGLILEGGDSTVTDGPIVLQNGSDHWRVVNTDVGPWVGAAAAKSGGITGNGTGVTLIGNHVHDISGGLNNCVDLDTGAADVDVSWNLLEGCHSGSGVQTIDSLGTVNLENIQVHHNVIRDTSRYGIIIADGTVSAHVYDNDIANTDGAGIRINQSKGPLATSVEHNTVFNPCRKTATVNAGIVNTDAAQTGTVSITNNVFVKGPQTLCTDGYLNDGIDLAFAFAGNDWSGLTPPTRDQTALTVDPGFVDAANLDFHLTATSALINASRQSFIGTDADATPRTDTPDLGAYEYVALAPAPMVPVDLTPGCAASPGLPLVLWAFRRRRHPRRSTTCA